jgi:hypothetical protein
LSTSQVDNQESLTASSLEAIHQLIDTFSAKAPAQEKISESSALAADEPATSGVFTYPQAPVSMEDLSALFPNLTPEEKLDMAPLFSKSFLYQGSPAQQFANHLDAMMQLTRKMRAHVEKEMELDKEALEKIQARKIENNKLFLEYEQKYKKWEWTKNVLDCISLTLNGLSTAGALYAYINAGPAAPPVVTALQAAAGSVFSAAALILRMKKPEAVKMNMALSTLALVSSLNLWYANGCMFHNLTAPDPLQGLKPTELQKQIKLFSEHFTKAVGCLVDYKRNTCEKGAKKQEATLIKEGQKFQKKSDSISDNANKYTMAEKHFSTFISVATSALEQLRQMIRQTSRGG